MFKYKIDSEVELKMLGMQEAEALFRLTDANRQYLREWMPWIDETKTSEDTRLFIEGTRKRWAKGLGIATGIEYRGELCGVIDLHGLSWTNRKTAVGYWLGASFQGNGIMTRACRAIVDYAVHELKLHRIEICAGIHNVRSRAIPERLGFQLEGIARGAQLLYGRYIDLAVYSVLADEWSESARSR
ncbi:GNAT family N-acetyltransferase [Paenibacillus allorhizosphaerae]|uniref:Ribosomal N-acetyltransferase YdaF n=1 Tax=Paenibacillus allorhizosphaerae TaxID=2849866 RepID=A0ABM8VKE2_9BACL|nr:GNAT family protein [Paenibacillus allorhizosphaerae]CAG7646906.1 Putative ribosomal N-acetyltransferase YdaF [Paenibacillus allorhizosphaerae]